MTFSIVAMASDPDTGEPSWGVAVASKFLAVGNVVPAAVAGVGALATQAHANVSWKGLGLGLLDEGYDAAATVRRLVEEDDESEHRQIGIVDAEGHATTWTGEKCFDWAGGLTEEAPGEAVAVQGNILTGPGVPEAMLRAWRESTEQPLPRRLLAALAAGDAAGGDSRGRQSAALLVVREGAGYAGLDDVAVDLRVDDHARPVEELGRLLGLNDLYLTASTDAEKVSVDDDLRAELDERARSAGRPDFLAWVGAENYEMRVAPDGSWIDEKVLAIIRGEQGHPTTTG